MMAEGVRSRAMPNATLPWRGGGRTGLDRERPSGGAPSARRYSTSYSPAISMRRRIFPTGDFGIDRTNT